MKTTPLDIGAMRTRVAVQQATRTPNELGEVAVTWADVSTRWARVRPIKAAERLRADADVAENVTHIVDMRFFEPFNSTDYRLTLNEGKRILDITGLVDTNNLRRYWEVSCNEVKV